MPAPPEDDIRIRRYGRLLMRILRGLQFKATLLLSLTLFVVATLGGAAYFRAAGDLSLHIARQSTVELAAGLALAARDPLARCDRKAAQVIVDEHAARPTVLYAVLLDHDGALLAHALDSSIAGSARSSVPIARRGMAPTGQTVLRTGDPNLPPHFDIVVPVALPAGWEESAPHHSRRPSALVGYARLGYNLEMTGRNLTSLYNLMFGAELAIVLLTVPLGFLTVKRIVAPLNALTNAVSRFASGDYDVRSNIRRTDEIGELAKCFNSMADQLSNAHRELSQLNSELEERVRQRTLQLQELAIRDPLTGLHNRRHLAEVLNQRFAESIRYRTELSCIMIDLDEFKAVNDRFGHRVGDELLVLLAKTIAGALRATDLGARYGGDEFVIVLPHTDASQARRMSERIVEYFQTHRRQRLPHVSTGLSIGIAGVWDRELRNAEQLINAADRAMYEAKAANRQALATLPAS